MSQADILLHLGMDEYQLVRHDQTAYAVPVDGLPIARPMRAKGGFGGTGSLRQLLNRAPGGGQAGLGLLRELSALAEPSWRMAVAWLLAGLRPDMPRPIAYFNG